MTDVTGFGLLGHLMEVCEGSGVVATIRCADLPVLACARALADEGLRAGAAGRNKTAFAAKVNAPDDLTDALDSLLYDPQTSGGLMVACAPEGAAEVLAMFHDAGYAGAAVVGEVGEGDAAIDVR